MSAPRELHSVVQWMESRGNQNATSPKGARGPMQVMDATARSPGYGITPIRNNSVGERERVGHQYLDALYDEQGGDPALTLAAYNCFDDATQILTKRGWIAFDQLAFSDEIASVDIKTKYLTYAKPLNIIRMAYTGMLKHFKSDRFDMLVTPNHNMLVGHHDTFRLEAAQNLKSIRHLTAVTHNNQEYPISDAEIRIVAWVLADGSITYQSRSWRVMIYQRGEKDYLIRDTLLELGWNFTERSVQHKVTEICGKLLKSNPKPITHFRLAAPSRDKVFALISTDKEFPEWAYRLSKRQFGIFLDTLLLANGNNRTDPKRERDTSISARANHVDSIQSLCIAHGHSASIPESRPWLINIRRDRQHTRVPAPIDVPYTGAVFCAESEQGTLVVRRNGKVAITGNSGPGAVQKHGGVPPYKETQKYVGKGLQLLGLHGQQEERAPITPELEAKFKEIYAQEHAKSELTPDLETKFKEIYAQEHPEAPKEDKSGPLQSFKSSWKGTLSEGNKGAAQLLESAGAHELAQGREQAAKEYAQEQADIGFTPTTQEDINAQPGYLGKTGEWLEKNITEPGAGMAARYGVPMLAAPVAAAVAPEAMAGAGVLGFMATDLPAEMGENLSENERVGGKPLSTTKNLATGLLQSFFGGVGIPGLGKVSGLFLKEAAPIAEKLAAKQITLAEAKQLLGSRIGTMAKALPMTAAQNAAVITAIDASRRGVTGQEMTSPEALAGYGESIKEAGPLMPVFAGLHGATHHAKGVAALEKAVPTIKPAPTDTAEPAVDAHTEALRGTEAPSLSELRDYETAIKDGSLDLSDPATQHLQHVIETHHPGMTEKLGGKYAPPETAIAEPTLKTAKSEQAQTLESWGLKPKQKAYKELAGEDLTTPEGMAKAEDVINQHLDNPKSSLYKSFNEDAFNQHKADQEARWTQANEQTTPKPEDAAPSIKTETPEPMATVPETEAPIAPPVEKPTPAAAETVSETIPPSSEEVPKPTFSDVTKAHDVWNKLKNIADKDPSPENIAKRDEARKNMERLNEEYQRALEPEILTQEFKNKQQATRALKESGLNPEEYVPKTSMAGVWTIVKGTPKKPTSIATEDTTIDLGMHPQEYAKKLRDTYTHEELTRAVRDITGDASITPEHDAANMGIPEELIAKAVESQKTTPLSETDAREKQRAKEEQANTKNALKRKTKAAWDKLSAAADTHAAAKGESFALSTEPETKHTAQSLQRHLPKELKALIASGKAVMHDTQATLPGENHPPNVKGMTTPDGVTHYVANRLTPNTLESVMLHEAGVHAGMARLVGPKLWDRYKAETMASQDPAFIAARAAVPKSTPEHLIPEETLAHLVEHAPKHPLVRRIISAIRNWARANLGIGSKFTEADARQLAVSALRREAKTASKTARGEAAYAHADPIVNETLDPANRLTTEAEHETLKDAIKKAVDSVTPSRIGTLDATDGLGAALKGDSIYDNFTKKLSAWGLARQNKQIGSVIRASEEQGPVGEMGDGTLGVLKENHRLALSRITEDVTQESRKEGADMQALLSEVWRTKLGEEDIAANATFLTMAANHRARETQFTADAKALHKAGASLTEINKAQRHAKEEGMQADKLEVALRGLAKVTPEHSRRAAHLLKTYPKIQEFIDRYRDVIRADVNLQRDVGLIDAATAVKYNAKKWYVPMHTLEEPGVLEHGAKHWTTGTGSKTQHKVGEKRRKGHEHEVNIIDNIRRQHAFMIATAAQNSTRLIAAERLSHWGLASLAKDQSLVSKDGNLAAYKDGKKVWYKVDDANALLAFQDFHHDVGPLLGLMSQGTKWMRYGALMNPVYWYRQLVRDPIMATFVADAGIITPIHSLYHFGRILMDKSPEAKELRRRGMIGPVDLVEDYNSLHKQMGRALAEPRNDWTKVFRAIQRVHEASDTATRVAVYKSALKQAAKEGLTGQDAMNYAAHKARESINFSVHGASQSVHTIRHMVPFFSSTLNGLDTVWRALKGTNLNAVDKARVQAKFRNRAAMMMTMSAAYAMLMQSDESYQDLNFDVSGNNWLIPAEDDKYGRHSFYRIPAPYEVGFSFKTVPELAVRWLYGTATGKEVLTAFARGVWAQIPPLTPIPQFLKPAIEVAANTNLHNWNPIEGGRAIESAHDLTLPSFLRGHGDSAIYDVASKHLHSVGIEMSPKKLKHFFTGYFAEFTAMGEAMANAIIADADKTPMKSPYKQVMVRGIMTDPEDNRHMSEYYRLANGAQSVVNALNMAKSSHDKGLKQELKADPETRVQTRIAKRLDDSQTRIQEYRKRIRVIGNQPDSQENRDKIADLRFKMNNLVEKSVTKAHQIEERLRD